MDYQFSYLIGDFALLGIWLILFLWRKDVRKMMLLLSLIFGIAGVIVEFVYVIDWWHPLTITNTSVGIGDFIFGFVTGGIAAAIYEEVFKKKVRLRHTKKREKLQEDERFGLLIIATIIFFLICALVFKVSSFQASLLSMIPATLYVWFRRPDLIIDSLASGFLLMCVSSFFFIIPEYFTPGWVHTAWYLENLSGIIIFKAPLEDIIWFFLAGALIGPLYEYWREGTFIGSRT